MRQIDQVIDCIAAGVILRLLNLTAYMNNHETLARHQALIVSNGNSLMFLYWHLI